MSSDCSYVLQPAGAPQVERQQDVLHFDRLPFALAPDADLMFWTDTHRQAADALRQGIERESPVILITGETGTGKTTLVQDLLADEGAGFMAGLLPGIRRGSEDFVAWLLLAFRQQVSGGQTSQFGSLQALVTAAHGANRRCVLIVDEAQDATDDELQALRLLTNLGSDRRPLLQVVLVGQPALRNRLGEARHASLAARIGADAHLSSMSAEDTAGYIRHRLVSAGGRADAFTPGALATVHRVAQGNPRKTNLLCGLTLTEADRRTIGTIDAALVRSVGPVARPGSASAGPFGTQEVGKAFRRLPDGIATAALPPNVASLLAEGAAGKAQEAAPAGPAELRSGPSDSAGSVATGRTTSAGSNQPVQRPSQAPPPPANAPGRVEARRLRKRTRVDDPPSSSARPADNPPASPNGASEDVEAVRQLAFDAMASLADYENDQRSAPRREISNGKGRRSRTDTAKDDRRVSAPKDVEPRPAQPVRQGRGSGLALATAAVATAIFGIGCYMAWSVHDALAAASGAASPLAAASLAAPLDRSAGPAAPVSGENTRAAEPDSRTTGRQAILASPAALTTPALPTIAAPEVSATGLFSLGLDLAFLDRETAAIAFARAASRGHARAAYYLAQIYETGDGVPRNRALAHVWYAASGSVPPGDRPASLDGGTPPNAISQPRLLSAARTSDGMLELVWTSAAEVSGVEYLIEVFDAVDQSSVHAERTARSSYRLPAPEGELLWRVTAETPSAASASDLQRIPSAV